MSDPNELFGIIDENEMIADSADRASLEALHRLGNFIEAAAHERLALRTSSSDVPEDAAKRDDARRSAATNRQDAIDTMDEVINSRVRGLYARHMVTQARNRLLISELIIDEAQLGD